MTTDVVTVAPETSLKEVAALLARARISGVPVCDTYGEVLGILSEADILMDELVLAEGGDGVRTAGEAMTVPVITVTPSTTAADAARLMIDRRVNRLPVVEDGLLVGIVTRADLVRAFVRTDADIEREINDDVLLHTLWVDPATVSVKVVEGEVTVAGEVDNRTTAQLVAAYIRRVPGVVRVRSDVHWEIDDQSHPAVTPSHYVDGLTTY
jgi:CBS domain-containing protein